MRRSVKLGKNADGGLIDAVPGRQDSLGPPSRSSSKRSRADANDKDARGVVKNLHKIGKAGWITAAVIALACVVTPYFDWQATYCPVGGSECIVAGVRFSPFLSDCYVQSGQALIAADLHSQAFYEQFSEECPFSDMNGFGAILFTFVPWTVVVSAVVAAYGWNFVPIRKKNDLTCCAPRASAMILVVFAIAHFVFIYKVPPMLKETFHTQQTNQLCVSWKPGRPSLSARLGNTDNQGYCMTCQAIIPPHIRADVFKNKVTCEAHLSDGYWLAIATSWVGVFFFLWVVKYPVDPRYKDWTPISGTWSEPGYDWLSLYGPETG